MTTRPLSGSMILFFLILALHFNTTHVYAAKARVKSTAPVAKKTTSAGFSSAKLSRSTNSIILNLFNLTKASKVSYLLSYNANGIEQGAMGSVTPSGSTDSRNLYFGTCSHGVCTAHRKITGATLTVTTTLKSGGTNTKRYRVKV